MNEASAKSSEVADFKEIISMPMDGHLIANLHGVDHSNAQRSTASISMESGRVIF
jgi:hypothetical protein